MNAALGYQTVLDFWFEEIDPKLWWAKNAEFDQTISERFIQHHAQASRCELFAWRTTTAIGKLSEIIALCLM